MKLVCLASVSMANVTLKNIKKIYPFSGDDIKRNKRKAKAKKKVEIEVPEEEKVKEPDLICADCGRPIKDSKKRDGSVWKAADIAKYTQRGEGRQLCVDCGKVAAAKREKNG